MAANASLEQAARELTGVAPPVPAAADHSSYAVAAYAAAKQHSHSASEVSGVNRTSSGPPAHPLPHGYSHAQIQSSEAHIHPELRSSHEPPAAVPAYPPVPNMIPSGPSHAVAMSVPPAVVPQPVGVVETGEGADGRKAKRELSQSKRAAQNRAAQRAFRQRKEGYIKKLEQQVRDYGEMETSFKGLQAENYTLRDYVLRLQSRLLDAQGEYPQPPPGINLVPPNPQGQPEAPSAAAGGNPLEVAAQAVAGLSRSEHLVARNSYAPARTDDDARTAEEITRQLQADGAPDGMPSAPM
ncbi:putative transcription factor kapC [Staphylotrichum tortipilum]|uniref:Putative transcription factor kapC n=1 Tax=Staphylotrichum tortipilum TaxID=2831512 RepID=A0AAN6MQ36_9PEZI|nr:putative transcription factor kapC [Staphylotrichum longicolle]